ncbi:aldo/keto reductase [Miniphocaeibacter halophilus]|uniref:Aldo/keto reductase n=1 Tax=Miniphocaeibacter halophilus TaxID=2931922 RepID=A0AC61MW69_9FIRM|nr:aldo/keto reductase [Miniphocaeibacter halophilus]QQK08119.1 aldo/keto reductase [Miniphocaeibacter halophilus]
MEKLLLKNGNYIPKLGQGTWRLGENSKQRKSEVEALQFGIEKGLNLIDTAEMYGEGGAELIVKEAIKDFNRRDLFIVSKVYPHNASRKKIFSAVENTLKRLGSDYLDLYLLHWRGTVPLKETIDCFEEMVKQGIIKQWGVSNFDTDDMKELFSIRNGSNCVINQVLYHLGSRGTEYDLQNWLIENNTVMMAYCPLAQGGYLREELIKNKSIIEIAKNRNITVYQLLLGFVLNRKNTIAIPKATKKEHIEDNINSLEIVLNEDELKILNREFPAPNFKTWLDIV